MAMNIYYTAKDIEEMAAKGIQQIELSSGVTLTDFARETAQQFNITLVNGSRQAAQTQPSPSQTPAVQVSSKYNKPKGCQHGPRSLSAPQTNGTSAVNPTMAEANSTTVNRLIDLMGKVVKRGG